LVHGNDETKQNKQFTFIPLLNIDDMTSFSRDKVPQNLLILKEKQWMAKIGKYLMEIYTGRKFKQAIKFNNLTDVYIQLNFNRVSKKVYDIAEPYFGVPKTFTDKLKNLDSKNIQFLPDDKLKGSFYELVYKLAVIDVTNKKQFSTFKEGIKHPFIKFHGVNTTKSDT